MSNYDEIRLAIFESYYDNQITESDKNELLESVALVMLYNDIITEAENEKIKEFANKAKQVAVKAGKSYAKGLDKIAEFGSKKVVKAPGSDATPEVYAEYERKLKQWRTRFKAAEIIAAQTIAIGPLDWLVTVMNGIAIANDPDVKEAIGKAKDKAKSIVNKVKELKDKLKRGIITEDKLNSEVNSVTTAGAAVAKQVDSANKKSKQAAMAVESVFNLLDGYVLENGAVTDRGFGILNMIIERADFSERPEMFDVVCNYCGV